MVSRRRQIVAGSGMVALALVLWIALAVVRRPAASLHETLPGTLSDAEFWNLITEFSEPGGYFQSDNFVSNESTYQQVIPDLTRKLHPGGVYLGVGPDQNFTYIAALHPKLAIITDIRRQNMLLHLVYKALFEMSATRVEFLSKLFSRPLPDSLNEGGTPEELFGALEASIADTDMADENLAAILKRLRSVHEFSLAADDVRAIEYVY